LNLYGSCQAAGAIGELVNCRGRWWDMQGDSSISYGCGSELVINQGQVRKSGGTGTTTIYPVQQQRHAGGPDRYPSTSSAAGKGSGVHREAGATLAFSTSSRDGQRRHFGRGQIS